MDKAMSDMPYRFKPRAIMEKAIEVMRLSIAESRSDGKASPKVGAVLVLPSGSVSGAGAIVTAHRGELREGDHAEFTLLERKCRDKKLDGSVLFCTLEPCAPGSRNHPKLPCAERIVLARIKEVYIGIEDPDPTVDRKGIKYLQDSGVTVRMFDRDLQELIREANSEFIAQAIERAAANDREKKPQTIKLSPLEDAFALAQMSDLSEEALEQFRSVAKINDRVRTPEFCRRLVKIGLLKEDGIGFAPTGFGLILFGTSPRDSLPQAGLLGTIHLSNGREDTRDFAGAQVLAPQHALQWMRDKLPDPIVRSEAQRKRVDDAFYELVREGIVNALVHRDYAIEGAKCQMLADDDVITIMSPGCPPPPIKLDQLQKFDAPMLSRNPVLHYVFSQMELAEERGLGLRSMKERANEAGLPLPSYSWQEPYLVLKVHRTIASATRALDPMKVSALSDAERRGLEFLRSRNSSNQKMYRLAMDIDARAAQRQLKKLVDFGLVRRVGDGPATVYVVNLE